MAIPPSTAAPAILAARPISIAFAEAAEALASFGFGSRRAGGIEHLRPPLRGDRSGKIAELLRLERRSEAHTTELQSLMRISYAVFCFQNKKTHNTCNLPSHRHNQENKTS